MTELSRLVSTSVRESFWEQVRWCATNRLELDGDVVGRYQMYNDNCDVDVAILTYCEHPMNIASDLAGSQKPTPADWSAYDLRFPMGVDNSRDSAIHLINDGEIESNNGIDPSNNARIERLRLEIGETKEVLLEAKQSLDERPRKTSRKNSGILIYFGVFSSAVVTVVANHLTSYWAKIIAMIASLVK